MSEDQTFVHACLVGSALLGDVDDWVDRWHRGEGPDDLNAYLGFTPDEGKLWAEQPEALRFVIAAHRYETSVANLLEGRDSFALAARAGAPEDAKAVHEWLRARGRIT